MTPFGRYKYLRPPSGINLAPEEFESKLHNKLDGLPGVEVISDDTLVMGYGENEEKANQNHKNLLRLLDRSRKGNIRLNSSKMNLRKSEVRFLGHLITMNRLKPNPDKVKAVEMPKPQIRNCQVSWDSLREAKGLSSRILSATHNRVVCVSSLMRCSFSRASKIFRTDLILRSHIPP